MKMREARERVLAKLKAQEIEPIDEQRPFRQEGPTKPPQDSGQGSAPSFKDLTDSFPYLQLIRSGRPGGVYFNLFHYLVDFFLQCHFVVL
jgi:hypothetical protein